MGKQILHVTHIVNNRPLNTEDNIAKWPILSILANIFLGRPSPEGQTHHIKHSS